MTEPQQDDTTVTDELVERTDNGWRQEDPLEQPSQDPGDLPAGTATGDQ
jgi:hypothetical protein